MHNAFYLIVSDNLSPEDRLKTMRAVKGKGTSLERRLWAMLAGLGIKGWKKNVKNIIGKPDVVFIDKHVAIFIDGCFWHGCPYCQRKLPKKNHEYWERKIQRNVELAQMHDEQLKQNGWTIIRVWEHELADLRFVRSKILRVLQYEEQ
jgi:DNA mismatch endonuclease (patch repair protein)